MKSNSNSTCVTYMESWSDELMDLSIPSTEIELSRDDMLALGSSTPSFRAFFDLPRIVPLRAELRSAITSGLKDFPDGVFPRLGACSFKRLNARVRALHTPEEVLAEITALNERTAAALRNAIRDDYPQSLYLREWREIPAWSEFRVFLRDRRIVGISQYHHRDRFPEIRENLEPIAIALVTKVQTLLLATPLRDFVADFYVGYPTRSASTLIEINPYGQRSDAGLYSWSGGGNFDGKLRYRRETGDIETVDVRAMLAA